MLKRVFASGVALGLSAGAAAADEPGPMPSTAHWDGFYAGVFAGFMSADNHWKTQTNYGYGPYHDKLSDSGGIFGGLVGVNFVDGNIVYGGEADYGFSDLSRTRHHDFFCCGEGFDISSKNHAIGSLRARLGWATSQDLLLFVTGGFAFGQNEHRLTIDAVYGVGSTKVSNDTGWVLGGGIEHHINDNLFIRAEGLYYDFGSKSGSFTSYSDVTAFHVDTTQSVFRVSLGYHL